MIKRIINFLDRHRVFLVFLILLIITILFFTINSILFFSHSFKSSSCTENIDEVYCFHNDNKIFKNAESERKKFFKESKEKIDNLKENYDLPDWNKYTSYYYEIVALLNFNNKGTDEELYNFFHIYNNTYDITNFYKKYNFYYDIFYHYKINLNN